MQIEINQADKVIINILLTDVISGTKRSNDRTSRRYAQKIANKFDFNAVKVNVKLNELIMLTNLVSQAIKISVKQKVKDDDKEKMEILKENIKNMSELYNKFVIIVESKKDLK